MTTLMWHEHLDKVDKGGCSTVLWILYKLKDSLALLHKPDPYRDFKLLTEDEQVDQALGQIKIIEKNNIKRQEKLEKKEKLAKQASEM